MYHIYIPFGVGGGQHKEPDEGDSNCCYSEQKVKQQNIWAPIYK